MTSETEKRDGAQEPSRFDIKKVEFVKSAVRRDQFPGEKLPQVAFVGRSNVGKSSLLNTLANRRQLAHVSSTPGRTQLVNFFRVNDAAFFVDLPGYGFARAPQSVKSGWEKMITGYLTDNPWLRVIVALFDARRERTAEDQAMLDWLAHYQIPFIAVLTKIDKLTHSERLQAVKKIRAELESRNPLAIIPFSAQTRQGRDDLLQVIGPLLAGIPPRA